MDINRDELKNIAFDLESFKSLVKVDSNNLKEEASQQPGLYAYWSTQAALAEAVAAQAELELDALEAQLYETYGKQLKEQGLRITEKSIETNIKKDPTFTEKSMELIEWKTVAKILRERATALRQRSLMIWIQGKFMKDESDEITYMGNA